MSGCLHLTHSYRPLGLAFPCSVPLGCRAHPAPSSQNSTLIRSSVHADSPPDRGERFVEKPLDRVATRLLEFYMSRAFPAQRLGPRLPARPQNHEPFVSFFFLASKSPPARASVPTRCESGTFGTLRYST
ncbi:uncharacterized protein LY89DRAFT_214562 [Mollisia scopiformis]|uniref:Uncharacterized protein n=1 Tax=Mollisia scopiformis TaxID=149040 RepID=A0A194WV81_MOLSC|nr:uncharacterized protein LY89DRAFT_214562 [Mollisia scopiformis]KUJ11876.1 hypothetical protein LY89DRAFT_214562 [Mollisia scopiformis]